MAKYPKVHDDYVKERAFLYIKRNNLYAEFLTEQGVEFDKDRPHNAWYDFIEKHSNEDCTHIYTGFVKRHLKKARAKDESDTTI